MKRTIDIVLIVTTGITLGLPALASLRDDPVVHDPPAVTIQATEIAHKRDCPRRYGQWRRVPKRIVGVRVDLLNRDGTRRVTPCAMWHVDETTLIVWPHNGDVGTS